MVAKATGLLQQQNYVVFCIYQASCLLHTAALTQKVAMYGQLCNMSRIAASRLNSKLESTQWQANIHHCAVTGKQQVC